MDHETEATQIAALGIANAIEVVIAGQDKAATYLAIGMILGASESRGRRPNLPEVLRIIGKIAHDVLDQQLAKKAAVAN